jgi:hypothetical protein
MQPENKRNYQLPKKNRLSFLVVDTVCQKYQQIKAKNRTKSYTPERYNDSYACRTESFLMVEE